MKRMSQSRSHRKRRGVVLAAAVACLMLAILLSAALAKSVLERHRRLLTQQKQTQALWLAESAASRAAARLGRDADYAGETWEIPAGELGGAAGKAIITVSPGEDDPAGRRIAIEAHYPDDPVRRVMIRKEFTLAAAEEEES